jgi:hypothetical protein
VRKPGFFFILLLGCALLMLIGCAGQAEKKADDDNMDYKISKQVYIDKNIMIIYPQVTGMHDHEKQEKINALIKAEALYMLNEHSEEQLTRLSLKHEIKVQKPGMLSIAYSGYRELQDNAQSAFIFFTTNIDMRNGSRVRIRDLVNVDNDLAEKIKNGRFFPRSALVPVEQVKPSKNELIQALKTADRLGAPPKEPSTYTYFTSGSLGVSIKIPHRFGDHIEIEVDYQDIANHIKAENEVWKSLY